MNNSIFVEAEDLVASAIQNLPCKTIRPLMIISETKTAQNLTGLNRARANLRGWVIETLSAVHFLEEWNKV